MPVVDSVAADYQGEIDFLAVAWKSEVNRARERAAELFSDNLKWGIDESVFALYGIPGQPASVIVVQGVVVDAWFGRIGADELRFRLDNALALDA